MYGLAKIAWFNFGKKEKHVEQPQGRWIGMPGLNQGEKAMSTHVDTSFDIYRKAKKEGNLTEQGLSELSMAEADNDVPFQWLHTSHFKDAEPYFSQYDSVMKPYQKKELKREG